MNGVQLVDFWTALAFWLWIAAGYIAGIIAVAWVFVWIVT